MNYSSINKYFKSKIRLTKKELNSQSNPHLKKKNSKIKKLILKIILKTQF